MSTEDNVASCPCLAILKEAQEEKVGGNLAETEEGNDRKKQRSRLENEMKEN